MPGSPIPNEMLIAEIVKRLQPAGTPPDPDQAPPDLVPEQRTQPGASPKKRARGRPRKTNDTALKALLQAARDEAQTLSRIMQRGALRADQPFKFAPGQVSYRDVGLENSPDDPYLVGFDFNNLSPKEELVLKKKLGDDWRTKLFGSDVEAKRPLMQLLWDSWRPTAR